MDIDISVLRLMEREKDLPFEVLASAIEDALLTAYEKSDGAVHGARVDLNRKTGHVTVMAPEYDAEGQQIGGSAMPKTSRSTVTSPASKATSFPEWCSRAATLVRCWSTSARSKRSCR